jgi:cell division protein FtsQ
VAEIRKRKQAVRRKRRRDREIRPELKLRARFVAVSSIFVSALVGVSFGAGAAYSWLDKPIQEVVLDGEYLNFSRDEAVELAQPYLYVGILSLEMPELVSSLEQQPWVESASVARIWPNRIQISVTEHRPIMRWADRGLLSESGQVIVAPANQDYSALPLVYSEQSSPVQLMNQFQVLATALDQVSLSIGELRQKPSGDWFARLRNGVPVELGGADLRGKIQRIIRLWQGELADVRSSVAGIDARYTNGLVVSWHTVAAPSSSNS